MRHVRTLALCVAVVLSARTGHAASIILNGDVEDNTSSSSEFNLSNANFNAIVADATAFGTGDEIDLVTGTDFGIAPESGDWKLGLHTSSLSGFFDAFSFDLSSAIVAGTSYDLELFAALHPDRPTGTVEIGVSSSATAFGTLVFSATPLSTS